MNQFKNGTLMVTAATVITALLIVLGERHDPLAAKASEHHDNHAKAEQHHKPSEATTHKAAETHAAQNDHATQTTTQAVTKNVAPPTGPFGKTASADNAQLAVTSSVTPEHQPIWLDQTFGDFKRIDSGEVLFKVMPVSSNGLQGANPMQVVTNEQDKYAPSADLKSYNYQQMPMYNGGYYIAPMPSYLMSSVLPSKKAKQK